MFILFICLLVVDELNFKSSVTQLREMSHVGMLPTGPVMRTENI